MWTRARARERAREISNETLFTKNLLFSLIVKASQIPIIMNHSECSRAFCVFELMCVLGSVAFGILCFYFLFLFFCFWLSSTCLLSRRQTMIYKAGSRTRIMSKTLEANVLCRSPVVACVYMQYMQILFSKNVLVVGTMAINYVHLLNIYIILCMRFSIGFGSLFGTVKGFGSSFFEVLFDQFFGLFMQS